MVYYKWLEWQHTTSEIDFTWFNYLTTFKVIPQKRSYWTIFCKLSLNVPYQCLFRGKKKRDRSPRLFRRYMRQTYPIYACTGTNHARHFIGSLYILLQLEKSLICIKFRVYETIWYIICGNLKVKRYRLKMFLESFVSGS